MVISFRS